jgi:hypothetical protein
VRRLSSCAHRLPSSILEDDPRATPDTRPKIRLEISFLIEISARKPIDDSDRQPLLFAGQIPFGPTPYVAGSFCLTKK